MEKAGFIGVNVLSTRLHEVNTEIVRQDVGELDDEDLRALEGLSASALITAVRP